MPSLSLQQYLFKELKKRIPKHSSIELELRRILDKDLIEVLDIINFQKELSLNDAKKICDEYGIYLDQIMSFEAKVIPFRFNAIDYNLHSLQEYFHAILAELRKVNNWGPRQLIYAANDIPVFSLFQFPDLAAFKLYFWAKAYYNLPSFKNRQFSIYEIDKINLLLGEQAWRQYLKMPSIEIWSSEIVSHVLKQIFHAFKHNYFKNNEEAIHICEQVKLLLDHIEQQAETGRKHHPNNYPPIKENYQLFFNEVAITHNTLHFSSEDTDVTFILQNALNYLVTDNMAFCLKSRAWLENLMSNSTQISAQNDLLRKNFFNQLRDNVEFVQLEILKEIRNL